MSDQTAARTVIGVDFDNTIVCYDGVFHRVAVEEGLIGPEIGASKGAVRDHLRAVGREDDWTALQGLVYGARMDAAPPFPGVLEFFRVHIAAGTPIRIVSHKTRHPFLGPRHDLHAAARGWLETHGFFDPARIGMDEGHAFFELTKEAKLARIGALNCRVFIDDLPEFLAEPAFPAGVERLLFDPNSRHRDAPGAYAARVGDWAELMRRLPSPALRPDCPIR